MADNKNNFLSSILIIGVVAVLVGLAIFSNNSSNIMTGFAVLDDDGDGLLNVEETEYGTDNSDADTDNDGINDGFEIDMGLNATLNDTDSDGTSDGNEDTDLDNITNAQEQSCVYDPMDPDMDDDWIYDGSEDSDKDCVVDSTETDPKDSDTDNDGVLDGRDKYPLNSLNPTIQGNSNQCSTQGYVRNVADGSLVCDHRVNERGGHKFCKPCNGGDGCGGS